MINGAKITGDMLENFMKSCKFNDKGQLVVANETLYKKAQNQLLEMLKNTTREWWIQLESSEGSLAKMADEIDFEQKEGNPTKLSNKVTNKDSKETDDDKDEVSESFDFGSIFEDGDVHIHNYGKPSGEGEVDEDSFALGSGQTGNDLGGMASPVPTMTFASPSADAYAQGDAGQDPTGTISAGSAPATLGGVDGGKGLGTATDESDGDFDFDLSFLEEPEGGEGNEFGSEEGGEEESDFGGDTGEDDFGGEEGSEDDTDDVSFDEPEAGKKGKDVNVSFGKGKKEVEEEAGDARDVATNTAGASLGFDSGRCDTSGQEE